MLWLQNAKRWSLHHLLLVQRLMWLISAVALGTAMAAGIHWQTLVDRNAKMSSSTDILGVHAQAQDEIWSYARGYALLAKPEQALKLFYLPETSRYSTLRAYTKFAIGNLYFDWAMTHQNIEQGGAHQQQVAMIALAREAYKDALRIDPDFADARFNLELLDRRSPDKRTEGWQSETDGVTLKPFKKNGTAMMRDNERRGLP